MHLPPAGSGLHKSVNNPVPAPYLFSSQIIISNRVDMLITRITASPQDASSSRESKIKEEKKTPLPRTWRRKSVFRECRGIMYKKKEKKKTKKNKMRAKARSHARARGPEAALYVSYIRQKRSPPPSPVKDRALPFVRSDPNATFGIES